MKSRLRLILLGAFLCGGLGLRAQFTWNGLAGDNDIANGGNWVGGVAPTGVSGLDDLIFAAPDSHYPSFDAAFSVHDITLPAGGGSYNLTGSGQLTLNGDVTTQVGSQDGAMLFGMPLTLAAGTHTFTTGGLSAGCNGEDVYLFSQIDGTGDVVKAGVNSLIFDHAGNTFSGSIDLQQGKLLVHGDGALGTGLLMLDGGTLIGVDYYDDSHLTVLDNDVSLSANSRIGSSGGNGSITINGTTTAQVGVSNVRLRVRGDGVLTLGDVAETDPDTHFEFAGNGFTRIAGTASYTGGTRVDDGVRVIFALGAPTTGLLESECDGYVGTEVTTCIQTGFINHFDPAGTFGVIGFDSPDISCPQTFAGAIDLTGFDPGVRVGTMTAAILSGTITPGGSDYLFGGGGTLTVNSDLPDVAGSSEVQLYDGGVLYLHGNNTYTGDTEAKSGAIIFTGANSIPAAPDLYSDYQGYIGQTETAAGGLTANQYFALFYTPDTFGVVGFDADDPVTGRVVSDNMDFSSFDNNAFLGTATKVTFTGGITPSNNEYRFTGFRDGRLTVDSVLSGGNSVIIGLDGDDITSVAPPDQTFRPSVTLNGANSYTGGTTLQSGRLILGNNTALGTGPLTIDAHYVQDQPPGLTTNSPGLVIANDIIFDSSPNFYIGGANDFTLAGALTSLLGEGFEKIGPGTITLTGDNSAYSGYINVRSGALVFATDTAAGTGDLFLDDVGGSPGNVLFTSSAPVIGTLSGLSSTTVDVGSGTLTINQASDNTYAGTITGSGSLTKIGPASLTLEGSNTYAGNTTILDGTIVAANDSALHGVVTVNGGTLNVASGTTLSNAIVFGASGGTLAGNGTITSPVAIGTNITVSPGNSVGLLTFSGGLTMAQNGTYVVELQSALAGRGTGYDSIDVTGGLVFNATVGNPFTVTLRSLDSTSGPGDVSDFNNASGYSWLIAHADSLTGFDPNSVTIDKSAFTNSLGIGGFNVGTVGNDIFLNFSPVPEPSTFALMGLGLGVVLFPALRRRQRV